jgi:pentatricopeptide repeat protein
VSKLSKEGSWRKSLEFFEAASKLGFQPDTALTNAAISACDKGGKWQKALEIFDQMDQLRIPRDAITYSATISALSKGKQWNGALQVFEHMQRAGVDADVVTCCSLINALERGGQWEMAESLFLEMCTVPESGGSNSSRITSQLNSYNSPTSVLRAVVRHSSGVPAILPTVQENSHHGDEFGSLGIICSPVQGLDTSLPAGFANSGQGDAGAENESLSIAFQNMVSLSTNSPLSRERIDSSGSTGESSQSDATPGRRDSVSSSEVNQVVQQLGPEVSRLI